MPYAQVPRGSSAWGYVTGAGQYYRGSGSGMGPSTGGTGVFAQGQGNGTNGSVAAAWTPDIGYLFLLIIAEMAIFAWLARRI